MARSARPSATIARLRPLAAPRAVRVRAAELDDWRRETDPTWLPAIPGPARPVVPADPTSVLHLLKVSLPDRQSGYTIRSREVLRAQRAAGLDAAGRHAVRLSAGSAGGPAPSVEVVDGIRHHRLSPGAPLRGLLDTVALERTAAGAADVAVAERPAVLHAASGHRGYELALAGLALREHLRRPLVYEVRGFLEASWTGQADIAATAATAELTVRRRAQEDRILRTVDGVTTLGLAMRDELIARGVPADRISVVPNGIDPEAFAPTPRDPDLVARYGLRRSVGVRVRLQHGPLPRGPRPADRAPRPGSSSRAAGRLPARRRRHAPPAARGTRPRRRRCARPWSSPARCRTTRSAPTTPCSMRSSSPRRRGPRGPVHDPAQAVRGDGHGPAASSSATCRP